MKKCDDFSERLHSDSLASLLLMPTFIFIFEFVTYFMLEIHLLQYQTYTEVLVIVSELKKKFMLRFSCRFLEFRILIQR